MTLNQALTLIRQQPPAMLSRKVFLACGFQPLHLATFVEAALVERFPDRRAEVQTGLYGDLPGSLETAARSTAEACAVVVEWSDLDSRLGLRSSGGWGPSAEQDIVNTCREQWARILSRVTDLAAKIPVALVGPSLATPFLGHTAGWQMSAAEAELQLQAAQFLAGVARTPNIRLAHPSRLARLSLEGQRLDAKIELAAGFPYSIGHASALGSLLVQSMFPPAPMKGLITDLDNTLWSGIVGEIGVSAVCWSLDRHAQVHGLYQQQLRQLSEMGVLLGIVSKNEPAVVEEALSRADLRIPKDAFYPVRAGWHLKSKAVAEVLKTWNIGPESVVFVDDTPMELEEVRTAFPDITCIPFPARNPAKALEVFERLRDLFGKPVLQREDQLRQASIRSNAEFREAAVQTSSGDFLRGLQGKITFDVSKDAGNKRLLELINKTNQFNLNGRRVTDGEWLHHLEDNCSVVIGIGYEDKFGPLGTIAVVAGRHLPGELEVTSWVLSCRAFSRKIEHHTLDYLFRQSGAKAIRLVFQPTERNQPLQEFLHSLGLDWNAGGELTLMWEEFQKYNNELPHQIE